MNDTGAVAPPSDEESSQIILAAAWQVLSEVAYQLGTLALSLPEGDVRAKTIQGALRVKEQSDVIYELRAAPPRGLQHWLRALEGLIKAKKHVATNSEKDLDEIFCAIYDVHHRRCLWWRQVENATGMSVHKFTETPYRNEQGRSVYPVSFPTFQKWLADRDYPFNPESRKQIQAALRQHIPLEHHHLINQMPE